MNINESLFDTRQTITCVVSEWKHWHQNEEEEKTLMSKKMKQNNFSAGALNDYSHIVFVVN